MACFRPRKHAHADVGMAPSIRPSAPARIDCRRWLPFPPLILQQVPDAGALAAERLFAEGVLVGDDPAQKFH
jgi:hypothetical protein